MSNIELSADAQKILDLVKNLSAIELNQLVKWLEEEFGVSAAAAMVAWPAAGGADDGASDSVSVEIAEVGQQKIAVIKAIKDIMGVGLKEAKDLVGAVPAMVKEWIPVEEAEAIKAKLEEAWATVNLK